MSVPTAETGSTTPPFASCDCRNVAEADTIFAAVEVRDAKAAEDMPDTDAALSALCRAMDRMERLGWRPGAAPVRHARRTVTDMTDPTTAFPRAPFKAAIVVALRDRMPRAMTPRDLALEVYGDDTPEVLARLRVLVCQMRPRLQAAGWDLLGTAELGRREYLLQRREG